MSIQQTRRLVKDAQHMINGGDFTQARCLLLLAYDETCDYGNPTDSATLRPRIRHRMGQVVAHYDGPEEATKYFDLAESLFERENAIGRAITLRDYGWMLWRSGQACPAIDRLETAVSLFGRHSAGDYRYELERVVTEGMLARTSLHNQQRKLDIHTHVDEIVSGSKKLIYELDNLREMLPLLSGIDYWKAQARILQLQSLIHTKNELLYAKQDVFAGRVVSAITGPSVRTLKRLVPFSR